MAAVRTIKYAKTENGYENAGFTSIASKENINTITTTIQEKPAYDVKDVDENANVETKLYKRRWYVMAVFSFLCFTQAGFWNTWGPIAESSEKAFHWTDGNIALFVNWGPIGYLIATFPMAWLIDEKGLRPACLLAAFMIAVGGGIRCITDKPPYVTWSVNIAQCLNGLAGPVAMGAPPVLSARWFPVHERTTATAMQNVLLYLGDGLAFVVGPAIVRQDPVPKNKTAEDNLNLTEYSNLTWHNSSNSDNGEIKSRRHDIMTLMYMNCGIAVLAFLLVLLYFPSKPKIPPTVSESVKKVEFKKAFKQLIRNGTFWLICLTYGGSTGIFICWDGILDVTLKPYGFSETKVGWLGFYSLLAGCFTSLIVSRVADVFSKHIRLILISLYTGASAMMIWFTLLIQGVIPSSTGQLYSSIILFHMCIQSTAPLFFELACETTYPVGQGITSLVLSLVVNISGGIFLLIHMIPNIGTAWSNWCLLGAIVTCIPVLGCIKEQYNRSDLDEIEKTSDANKKK